MNFHVKFDRPIDIKQFNLWYFDVWHSLEGVDPWQRVAFMQQYLIDNRDLKMLAALSPSVGEGDRDGGLQGLWGRN